MYLLDLPSVRGALGVSHPQNSARGIGTRAEALYVWGDKVIEFYHCRRCGCLTRYESIAKHDDSRNAVNARMIAPEAIEGLRIRIFDGADTWQYLD